MSGRHPNHIDPRFRPPPQNITEFQYALAREAFRAAAAYKPKKQ